MYKTFLQESRYW